MQDTNDKNWQAAKQRSEMQGVVNFEELSMADIRRVDGTAPDEMQIRIDPARKSKAQKTYYWTLADGYSTKTMDGTFCLQRWGDDAEAEGQYKMEMQLQPEDLKCVQQIEFGIRRAVFDAMGAPGVDSLEEETAKSISEDFASSTNEKYNSMRAAVFIPTATEAGSNARARHPRIYWKVDSVEVAQLQRSDLINNPEDSKGAPIIPFKEMGGKNHSKRMMSVKLRPVLINLRSGVRWEVSSLVIGDTVSAAEKVWQLPSLLPSEPDSLQLAEATVTAGSGGKYVPVMAAASGAAPFFFIGGPAWLSVLSNKPKVSEHTQQTQYSLLLATATDSKLCNDLVAMRANISAALVKATNPNGTLTLMPKIKKTTKAAKSKSPEELVGLRAALLPEQTPEQLEKWGAQPNRVVRILLRGEASAYEPATVCYITTPPPTSVPEIEGLMHTDPAKLVAEGKLQVVPLSQLGAKAQVFVAVDMSRIDLIEGGLVAVCNMRARYIIALTTGATDDAPAPNQVEFGDASFRVRELAPHETISGILDTKKRSADAELNTDNSPKKARTAESPPGGDTESPHDDTASPHDDTASPE